MILVGALLLPAVAQAEAPDQPAAPVAEAPDQPAAPVAEAPDQPAAPVAEAPDQPAAAPATPKAGPQGEESLAVGKWPEGVVATAGSIWVAESGKRRVVRIDPKTSRVTVRVKIGRLPVSMGVAPDGAPIVLVVTDRKVKRIDPKTAKVKVIATLPDHGEGMVVHGDFAYVLLWDGGSSARSSVMRIDLRTGGSTRSVDTGSGAFGIAVGGGLVWVARGDGDVTTLDATTLEGKADIAVGGRPFNVASDGKAAFASQGSAIVRLSPQSREVTGTIDLGARVSAVAAWDDLVVGATEAGELWLLDPATLGVRARLKPAAPYDPRAIARSGDTLLLTHHEPLDGKRDHGTLVRVPID